VTDDLDRHLTDRLTDPAFAAAYAARVDLTAVTDLILSCLPVDAEDGTSVVEIKPGWDDAPPLVIWGDARRLATYIAAMLDSAGMLDNATRVNWAVARERREAARLLEELTEEPTDDH
jgi:hypothetical protein